MPLSRASSEWKRLYDEGKINDPEAFKGFLGILTLRHDYPDGSILLWSDRKEKWMFFETAHSLSWAKTKGDC